jgi:hypothetical protein
MPCRALPSIERMTYASELTVEGILAAADAYRARTGQWPSASSRAPCHPGGPKWSSINTSLMNGRYGVPAPISLTVLLEIRRGRPNAKNRRRLSEDQILRWARRHRERTGKWPVSHCGMVFDAPDTSWNVVDIGLRQGLRGLPGGSSLRMLLAKHMGIRNPARLPRLTTTQILAWADAHHARTGHWPRTTTDPIPESPGDTWQGIHHALRHSRRGLTTRITLLEFLVKHRQTPRRVHHLRPISEQQILTWIHAHHRRTGSWPTTRSGAVAGRRNESWRAVDLSLRKGTRGLPGSSSLGLLVERAGGTSRRQRIASLSEAQVRQWAEAHHRRHGRWPTRSSGPILESPSETWRSVWHAMLTSQRGLRHESRLAQFLRRNAQVRPASTPTLTEAQIAAWALSHQRRTGQWPRSNSGPVRGVTGLTWTAVNDALFLGRRGLAGGISLATFLSHHFGVRNRKRQTPLTVAQIVAWAKAHHARTGRWPRAASGDVLGAPGERWNRIEYALQEGRRTLPGGSSLAALLEEQVGRPNRRWGGPLSERQILAWSKAYFDRTGRWPVARLNASVHEQPTEHWLKIEIALRKGFRGLPGGSSLARLLSKHYHVRNLMRPPPLTIKKILSWADAHYERTGDWPSMHTGAIPEAPGESWSRIIARLYLGRGLPRTSLVAVLQKHRGQRYRRRGLPLTTERIVEWAIAHHELTGALPTRASGPVHGVPGEWWSAIDASLRAGARNLRGGSSLNQFLRNHYTEPYPNIGQPLTTRLIVKWAEDFRARTGRWPTRKSAFVHGKGGERWAVIDQALRQGHRGLPGGSSLATLLAAHRAGQRR